MSSLLHKPINHWPFCCLAEYLLYMFLYSGTQKINCILFFDRVRVLKIFVTHFRKFCPQRFANKFCQGQPWILNRFFWEGHSTLVIVTKICLWWNNLPSLIKNILSEFQCKACHMRRKIFQFVACFPYRLAPVLYKGKSCSLHW